MDDRARYGGERGVEVGEEVVACGRVDAFYERGLKRWDEAAGRLLVLEAGGVVADLEGEPHGVAAAATPTLLDELVGAVG